MADEWSDWIKHDGKPKPELVGRYIRVKGADGDVEEGILSRGAMYPDIGNHSLWLWDGLGAEYSRRVVAYQLRKPRGMAVLESALNIRPADPAPAPVAAPARRKKRVAA